MRVLYLYEELMGYTIATIAALARMSAEIHVIHWDHKKLTPYSAPPVPNSHFYPRSQLTKAQLSAFATQLRPDIVVVSGWRDQAYLSTANLFKKRNVRVVLAFDGQWTGSVRQRVATALGHAGYFKRRFSNAWIPGPPQFAYARALGFMPSEILYDLYSADTQLYSRAASDRAEIPYDPRRLTYVGRLERVKGIIDLIAAWQAIPNRFGWELNIIGAGSLAAAVDRKQLPGLRVTGFVQPHQLVKELAASDCFVLPSHSEPWGVAAHEAAAAALPLVLSDRVGSGAAFLIPGLNGFRFPAGDVAALRRCLEQLVALPKEELASMSLASQSLAMRITPETSAANLLSVLA